MTASPRSPLHSNALNAEDIRAGVEFICFHMGQGITFRGTFKSEPRLEGNNWHADVELRGGAKRQASLCDWGVIPYINSNQWNPKTFTVDSLHEATLPPPNPDWWKQAEQVEWDVRD